MVSGTPTVSYKGAAGKDVLDKMLYEGSLDDAFLYDARRCCTLMLDGNQYNEAGTN